MKRLIYRVIDNSTGDVVVEGSCEHCASVMKYSQSWLKEVVYSYDGQLEKGKYTVESTMLDMRKDDEYKVDRAVIKAWDDFVTPIREAYGIPRYREKSGVR